MATRNLIKAGLRGVKTSELVDKSAYVEAKMTGNVNFVNAVPTIASITAARTALSAALEAAVSGAHEAIAVKNEADRTLRSLLTHLSRYVNGASNGDVDVAVSSGFELVKPKDPVDKLEAPVNVNAEAGAYVGSVDLRWKKVRGGRVYNVYMTAGDPNLETGWSIVDVVSASKCTIQDLEPGRNYAFRIAALGSPGEGPTSEFTGCRAA
ncbi:MAG: fibronectin type III domain-containing protein [Flavobacteriales bacterium]|nr:MAG: fibronectin type III domain-containing protein [Flavobacteriales bacterium]